MENNRQTMKRKKPKNNNKPLIIVLIVLAIAVIVVVAIVLIKKGGTTTDPSGIDTEVGDPSERIPNFKSSISFDDMKGKMAGSKAINEDTIGWITVPGTNIDQEVVTPGFEGNNHYIYRTIEGVDNPGMNYQNFTETALFTSWRNNFEALGDELVPPVDRNYVIFGHNWTNYKDIEIGNIERHTMFAQLPSYTNVDFAKANPYIHFSTEYHHMVWKITSVLYTEPDWMESLGLDFNYITPGLSPENFEILINEYNERTLLNFDTGLTKDDTILTLSTCTREVDGAGEDQRFVVVARLLRSGESDKDSVKVTVNENPKAPIYK